MACTCQLLFHRSHRGEQLPLTETSPRQRKNKTVLAVHSRSIRSQHYLTKAWQGSGRVGRSAGPWRGVLLLSCVSNSAILSGSSPRKTSEWSARSAVPMPAHAPPLSQPAYDESAQH